MDKITLDRDVFKALASDTRLDILKALDVRQKTVTELAKELELNKATVFEHLEKLAAVGLIQKVEEDVERKWVYWQLTWTGRRLLHPEAIKLAVLLSTAGGSIAAAAAAAWVWLRTLPESAPEAAPEGPSTMAAPASENLMVEGAAGPDPTWLAIAIAFALLTLVLTGIAARIHLRARKARRARAS